MTEHLIAPLISDGGDVTRRISNSEVGTFLTCEKKYYYEFGLNLEPRVAGGALGKGTLLHEVLAEYYQCLKDGDNYDQARYVARSGLQRYLSSTEYNAETVMEVDRLLQGYWNYYQGDPDWEILEVEKGYDLSMTEDYEYSLRLDLLVRERDTGLVVLVDHKTAYDFWTQDDLDLNPQFPKYIGALRANGIMVDKAILNQIRSRSIKNPTMDQMYRRTVCKPSMAKIQNAMREQVLASQEIVKFRALPLEVQAANSKRILNKAVCKNCNVKPLCLSEFDGGDITVAVQTDFKQRTYGYNPTDVDMSAL